MSYALASTCPKSEVKKSQANFNKSHTSMKKKLDELPIGFSGVQQDQETGTSRYKGDDRLPEVFLETPKTTNVSLSDSKLLERCVRGKTLNPNKSINATVWVQCPKHKHHGVKVVQCTAASAVCHLHRGAESRERLMERLSIPGGAFTGNAFCLRDKSRL